MSKEFTYYLIPFASIPAKPPYEVWFASWSKDRPDVCWSREPPAVGTEMVVGVVQTDQPPPGATPLGRGTKDLPPPPGTTITVRTGSVSDFQQEFAQWLVARG